MYKRYRELRLTVLVLFASMATASAAAAQSPGGTIVGQVVDASTGRGLPGAQITIGANDAVALAGVDGRYAVPDAPTGVLEVHIAMLGYSSETLTGVELAAGEMVRVDVVLRPAVVGLEGIEVTAAEGRDRIAGALSAQRHATGVVSGISSEQIARGPDGDAAAAIRRVAGVTVQGGRYVSARGLGERYTTTALNGSRVPSPEPERRMVPLDLFPTGMLQSITTVKTFTPDQPGDFSGAQVDIRTREYPSTRQLSLSVSQGYNDAVVGNALPKAPTTSGDWLAAGAGPRRLPDAVRRTPRPSPGEQANAVVNAMRNAWTAGYEKGHLGGSLSVSLGGTDRVLGQEFGYLVSATYSNAEEAEIDAFRENPEGDRFRGAAGRHSVLLGGILNISTVLGASTRLSLHNVYNRSADNEARVEAGYYENHGTTIEVERLRYVQRAVRSSQLHVQHQVSPTQRLEARASVSAVSRQEPDRSEYVTWLDPDVPTWYNEEGAFRAYGGLDESSLELAADYHLEFGPPGSHGFRAGAVVRATERNAFDSGYSIRAREWTPTDPRWQAPPEEIFDGRHSSNGEEIFEIGVFNAGGDYRAEDRLAAAYAMVELSLAARLRLIAGARVERTELALDYEDVLGNTGTTSPAYTDVLPAATLVLDLTDAQKLRLSASRTLARPEYREVAPICYRAGLGEEQRCGNPDLRRTLIQNFDLRWEHYPSDAEVVSVALFAKRFEGPIEPRYQGRSGTNTLWFQNAERAVDYGVEIELQRRLDFVWDRLASVTVFANTTLMHSGVTTGVEGDPERRMTGQAPYVINAGATWTSPSGRASVTALYNVVGERITNARPSGQTVLDMVELPRHGLDLSLRLPVVGGMAAKLDLKNVLDSPHEVRQGELVRAYHRSGRSLTVGLSWRP